MASSVPPVAAAAPSEPSVADLALGEQLVIWAVRKRLESDAHGAALRRGFALAGGGRHARDAFAAFEQLFFALARNCRRDLWFHRCGCSCVSADELAILGLIAAEQAGDIATAWCCGQSLVVEPALGELLLAAHALGQALAERRLTLPLRHRLTPLRPTAASRRAH